MLASWLGDVALDEFRTRHLGQTPIARPGTARTALPVLDWAILGEVLATTAPPPDVLVVARGQLLPYPAPRDLTELRAYFRIGVGLGMRHTQRCHANLRRVADAFERDLGASQVQIFATPGAGQHGFSWHYDDEDVFIAQTAGVKDYYFRPNTVSPEVTAHATVFQRFHDETSPIHTATLVPGDFLYIPARWWHMAICKEDALSISVGVFPRSSP